MVKDVRALTDFERQLKKLNTKRRRELRADYQNFILNLEATRAQWKRVKDVEDAPLWTARMQDSSSNRGKSGGFRVYFFVTDSVIWLVHIQLRKDGNTVPSATLSAALKRAGLWPLE